MKHIKIFFLRLLLSVVFAFILSMFSDEKDITMLIGYVFLLLGLAYLVDYVRKRNAE